MRELIGYLVACGGAEEVVARMAAGIPQQFLSDSVRTGSPIKSVYFRENFTGDAVEEAAGITRL